MYENNVIFDYLKAKPRNIRIKTFFLFILSARVLHFHSDYRVKLKLAVATQR